MFVSPPLSVSFSHPYILRLIRGRLSSFSAIGRDKNCRSSSPPISGVATILLRGALVRHENRGAKGARIEAPRRRRGCRSLGSGLASSPAVDDLVERRELPQRGLGRSPGRQRFWCILGLKNDAGGTQNIIFWQPGKAGILVVFLCFCFIKQPCDNECGSGVSASSYPANTDKLSHMRFWYP